MIKIAEWFGSACSCAGALLLAQQQYLLGYCIMLAGSVAWVGVCVARRTLPGFLQWVFFLGCNALGIYNLI
jgi:drug/metabolite transporter (DMT)-like permease